MESTIIMIFDDIRSNRKYDIEVPLDITANELIYGLNEGFRLGIDMNDVAKCYLCAEEPRTLIRGDVLLEEFGLRDGSVITYRG